MRKRSTFLAASLLATTLAGCASAPAETSQPTATAAYGIDCPACFLLIECMRSGLGEDVRQKGSMQCERCCETLTFTTTQDGQIWVATTRMPQPMPLQVCAPMPPR